MPEKDTKPGNFSVALGIERVKEVGLGTYEQQSL